MSKVTVPAKDPSRWTNSFGAFRIAIGLAAVLAFAFAATVCLQLAGARMTRAVDLIGLMLAQFIAAASCLAAARRTSLRLSWFWSLMGASTASAGIGRLIIAIQELASGAKPTFPSLSDAAMLTAAGLGIGAILVLPSAPSRASTRSHALLNSVIFALSLFLIAWELGLSALYRASGDSASALWLVVGYVAANVIVGSILLRAISRARGSLRAVLLLLGCASVLITLATTIVGYVSATGKFQAVDQVIDVGFVTGFLLIGVAAFWPGVTPTMVPEGPVRTYTFVTPSAAIAAFLVVILGLKWTGRSIDASDFPLVLGTVLMVLLTISQVIAQYDSRGLLASAKQAKTELRNRNLLLNQVISHAPAGLARVGLGLRIIDANPRVGSILGTNSNAMVGLPLTQFLAAVAVETAVAKFRPFESSRTDTVELETQATRLDQTKVWLRWSITAVRDVEGKLDYFLLMFEDIDAAHAAQQTAIANLAGLERLNHLKSEFVSMVSHEFRTALTGIQGFSELMLNSDLEPSDYRHLAGDIFNDAQRLSRLITDMLELDRIEAGRMPFSFAPVDINRLATEAVERARAITNKHEICIRLDPAMPCVSGDQDRLMQVMTNLLSDAIKYSPDGGRIVVTARAGDGAVTVSILDHGRGIPPEFMDRLFDRYERYESKVMRTIVGTGLGLVIARRIVEAHGGHIWADSTVGVGSEFHFSLPLTRNSSPEPANPAAHI